MNWKFDDDKRKTRERLCLRDYPTKNILNQSRKKYLDKQNDEINSMKQDFDNDNYIGGSDK
jgi:hypothetical protein